MRRFVEIRNRLIVAATVLTVAVVWCVPTVRADERAELIAEMQEQEAQTQQTISDLEKQTKETREAIDSLQGQKEATQSQVNSLENRSTQLASTISGYTDQLDDLSEEIAGTESELAVVSSEIVRLNAELQAAHAEEVARYGLLKKRMQSVYESGGTGGMMQVLLTTGNLQDFFTTAEYLSAVVNYDFRKIREYQALQEDIAAKTAIVEEKESELDAYQAQLDERHSELADLTDTVRGQLDDTRNSLSSEKGKLVDYTRKLEELDGKMKALEAQTAAAQAKLAQQIAERLELMREDTSGSYAASASELEWLAATIQAEADGESYTGKLAVGSVIMNRVKSSAFPNDVVGVITQNLQFASYRSGKVELIISRGPNSTCIRAAQEVLDGARVGDYLFFMTQYYADYYGISEYTMIGNHAFFYRWIVKEKPPAEDAEQEDDGGEEDGGEEDGGGDSDAGEEESSGDGESEDGEEDSGDESDGESEDGSE